MIFQSIAPVAERRPPAAAPANARQPLAPQHKLSTEAMTALLQGRIDEAETALVNALQLNPCDAVCLNLQGVLHELRQQWRLARRCYGRAMRSDRAYLPAEQNMRRLYELNTFGKTKLSVALWDPLHRC